MDWYNELNLDNTMFLNTHVKKERCNIDKSVNNYGYKFIDFLQCNKMFILNGRTNRDYTGNVTCKGASAVDYCVCTSNIFKYVLSLNVLDFSPLLSDVHSPIEVLCNFHAPDDVSTALSNNHVNPLRQRGITGPLSLLEYCFVPLSQVGNVMNVRNHVLL